MSDEITVSASLKVRNGNLRADINPGALQIDQAVARGPSPGSVNVGTSEEVISFAELATLGWCLIQNLDATNYVDFGPESGGAMVAAIRVEAGEVALFRLVPGTTYRAKANTAACNVAFYGFND
jgi:hypothetical protein